MQLPLKQLGLLLLQLSEQLLCKGARLLHLLGLHWLLLRACLLNTPPQLFHARPLLALLRGLRHWLGAPLPLWLTRQRSLLARQGCLPLILLLLLLLQGQDSLLLWRDSLLLLLHLLLACLL